MLRMEYEKEVVLNICHCIEMHEQQKIFDSNNADEDQTPLDLTTFKNSHVHLGSRQRSLRLLLYEKSLEETIEFYGLSDSLTEFLCNYTCVEVYSSDFIGNGFEGHQLRVYWCKVNFTLLDRSSDTDPTATGLPSQFMLGLI